VLGDGDVSVAILSLGAITQDWRVPLGDQRVPVVLGYRTPQDYAANPCYLGIIAGRVASRISGAGFVIDGQQYDLPANDPPNHLHGGARGIHTQIWDMEPDGDRAVRLSLVSQHGDQGYPGRVAFEVTITLTGFELCYDMRATSDRPTPVNLAQHSYYNLMGQGGIGDHHLQIAADKYTPLDQGLIPTGQTAALEGRDFDLRQGRTLRQADPAEQGLDMNFVLNDVSDRPTACLSAPNGLQLRLTTDQPCLQLYTGAHLRPLGPPLTGQTHAPFSGVCLEPQGFPNAVNTPGFPSVLITPDQPYHQIHRVEIGPKAT